MVKMLNEIIASSTYEKTLTTHSSEKSISVLQERITEKKHNPLQKAILTFKLKEEFNTTILTEEEKEFFQSRLFLPFEITLEIEARQNKIRETITLKKEEFLQKAYQYYFSHEKIIPTLEAIETEDCDLLGIHKHLSKSYHFKQEKVHALKEILNTFFTGFDLYGRNIETLVHIYEQALCIYPLKYLKPVLQCRLWDQRKVPTIEEIEEKIQYLDGDSSDIYYKISQSDKNKEISFDDNDDNDDVFALSNGLIGD